MRKLDIIPLVHVPFGVWNKKRLELTFGKDPNPNIVKKIIKENNNYWDEVDRFLEYGNFDKVYQEASFIEHP